MKNLSVVLLSTTMVLFSLGCKSTKVILPQRKLPLEKKFEFFIAFPVKLDDSTFFTSEKAKSKYGDTIIFSSSYLNDKSFNPKILHGNNIWVAYIYRLRVIMGSEEIISFIKEKGGWFPNDQGLMQAWDQGKQYFPPQDAKKRDFSVTEYVTGFAEKPQKLEKGNGYGKHSVACISKNQDQWLFDFGCYEKNWYPNYYVLYFVPESSMYQH